MKLISKTSSFIRSTDMQSNIVRPVARSFRGVGGRGGGMGEAGVYFKNRGQIINVEMIGHASSKSLGSENFEI